MPQEITPVSICSLTIVVAVSGGGDALDATLRSVEQIQYKPFEIVFAICGENQSLAIRLTEWCERHVSEGVKATVFTSAGASPDEAFNESLSLLQTSHAWFITEGMLVTPVSVSEIIAALEHNPECGMIYFDSAVVDADGWMNTFLTSSPENALPSHLLRDMIAPCRTAVSVSLLRESGGWNTSLGAMADTELGLRLLLGTGAAKLSSEPLALLFEYNTVTDSDRPTAEQIDKALDVVAREIRDAGRDDLLKWIDARRAMEHAHLPELPERYTDIRNSRNSLKLAIVRLAESLRQGWGADMAMMLFSGRKPKK